MKIFLIGVFAALSGAAPSLADPLMVKVGVLREKYSRETLSILDIPAADDTLAGAQLGVADNNTTGKFTNQAFEVIDVIAAAADNVSAAIDKFNEQGVSLIIAGLSSARLLAAADRGKTHDALIFNATATDDSLRP